MILGNGHLVVVENDDQVRALLRRIVQTLQCLAAAERTVAENGNDILMRPFQIARLGKTTGKADRRGGVADIEKVMFAFLRIGITGYIIITGRIEKRSLAAGKDLVGVTLVRDIIDDFVVRRIEDIVQCHGGLHHAEIRTDMPAVFTQFFQQDGTDLRSKVFQFRHRELLHICRTVNSFKIHKLLLLIVKTNNQTPLSFQRVQR